MRDHGESIGPGRTGEPGEVTRLLARMADGDDAVVGALFALVYSELRSIARGQRRRNSRDATLDSTALLHEAYLKFAAADSAVYEHREHFYAVAARAMRQILVDRARRRRTRKRGGDADVTPWTSDGLDVSTLDEQAEFLLALDQGLARLEERDGRARRVAEMRFFGGFTEDETAEILGVDARTVRRDWAKAKTWLAVTLGLDASRLERTRTKP